MKIGILSLKDLRLRWGSTIRQCLQAEGLYKAGFKDFVMYSYGFNKNLYKQELIPGRLLFKKCPLFQKIKKLNVDLVHAHQYYSAMILRQKFILDLPSFKTLETGLLYTKHGSIPKRLFFLYFFNPIVQKRIEIKMIKQAEAVVCASESIKKNIINYVKDVDENKLYVVHNTIKVNEYPKSKCKELVVGVVGSFNDPLNIEALKMTYRIAKKVTIPIHIVGWMSEKHKSLFKNLKHVKIIGQVDKKGFMSYLNNISIMLLPYPKHCFFGGSKFKLLEAGACSIPVVSSPTGTVGFDHDEVILYGKDINDLIKQIYRLKDSNLRKEYGKKLNKIIKKEHDYIKENKKLIKIYRKCC